MTKVVFFADKSGLYGYEISGHSSDCEEDFEGKLLCGAVSSAAYLVANTVSEVIGDKVEASVSDGYMKIIVSDISSASEKMIEGLKLHLFELSKQYDSRLTITTEV